MTDTSIQIDREHFSSIDGLQIFFQANVPGAPTANILLVHGFGEHCGRYDELTQLLVAENYAVFRFDLRGHGRSDGKRGHIFDFDEYLQDFSCFKERALSYSNAASKTLLVGHSYGGLVSLSALLRDSTDISGLVLSSPFFGVADDIPKWKVGLGKLLSRYLPSFSLPTEIDPKDVSHDPVTVHEYGTDTLIGRTASTRWLTETLAAQATALANAKSLTLPVLWQQAGDDKLVCKHRGREVFDQLSSSDKTWIEYPEMFHELYFELEREKPIGQMMTWLETQIQN
jgi:lysophospholipase